MLIYRVEHTDGNGPYSSRGADDTYRSFELREWAGSLCWKHNDEAHPGPSADGIGYMDEVEVCGFVSRQKLTSWFREEMEALARFGFKIKVYDVPASAVRKGQRQCVFNRFEASLVEELSITYRVPTSCLSAWLEKMS